MSSSNLPPGCGTIPEEEPEPPCCEVCENDCYKNPDQDCPDLSKLIKENTKAQIEHEKEFFKDMIKEEI